MGAEDASLVHGLHGRLAILISGVEENLAVPGDAFDMEDLGEAHFVLGIEITRDRKARTLSISQGAYVTNILDKFGMSDCHPTSTPIEHGLCLSRSTDDNVFDVTRIKQYQAGALMYAAQGTRPYIAFSVTALSQFSSKPNEEHW